jgi:phage terminase large subunit-like protein
MSSADVVTAYARRIADNPQANVGRLQRLACERHMTDLAHAGERGLVWSAPHATHVIRFFDFLQHFKGEWAGRPLNLAEWQAFIVGCGFGWRREDDTRRFRLLYVEIPRKNGKSTTAGGLALYLAFFDGEPGAEVYTAATKREQARIVFDTCRRMVLASPALKRRIHIQRHNLSVDSLAAKLEPISSDVSKLDGLNVHGAVIDELHAHKTADVVDIMETATGARRQPMQVELTTAGVGQANVCWTHHAYTEAVLTGALTDEEWFGFIAHADPNDDFLDPAVHARANPNYGVSVKPDYLAAKAHRAGQLPGARNVFLQKHLNIWVRQAERWLDVAVWDRGKVPLGELTGRLVYGGLDLSATRDMTAFVLLFGPAPFDVLPSFWIPAAALERREPIVRREYQDWIDGGYLRVTPGNVVDYGQVRASIREAADRYRMIELGYDPWNAGQLSVELEAAGLRLWPTRTGFGSMHDPTASLGELVAAGQIRHGGHPVLRWMAQNMVIAKDADGRIKPDRKRAVDKIDGMVALIYALDRFNRNQSGSAYDDHDLFIVGDDEADVGPAPL